MSKRYWLGLLTLPAATVAAAALWLVVTPGRRYGKARGCGICGSRWEWVPSWAYRIKVSLTSAAGRPREMFQLPLWVHAKTHPSCLAEAARRFDARTHRKDQP